MKIAYPPVPPNESGLKAEIARYYWLLDDAGIVVRIGDDCMIDWASDQRDPTTPLGESYEWAAA